MSDGSSTVHVTVDTREVANEVSRLKKDIIHVAKEVKGVSNNINVLQAELLAQMAVTIERITAVKNEVSRSIESAAQAKVVESATDIFGKIGIITSSAKRISQQYHKSVIRCGRASEKFDRLNDEVKISYHTDIQRLGKYIFYLWNNHYRKVEDRIQKQHSGFLTTIKHSVEQIRKYRENKLEELLMAIKEKLACFLTQRKNFHDSISMITARKLNAPLEKIAIPIIVVKKVGDEFAQIKVGHEVVPEVNDYISYCLKETDIFTTYRSDKSSLDKCIHWRRMTPGEIEQMESNFKRLLEKNLISREYRELLVKNLRKNPPLVPEKFEWPGDDDIMRFVNHPPEEFENAIIDFELEDQEDISGENSTLSQFSELVDIDGEVNIKEMKIVSNESESEEDMEDIELDEEREL